jgi:hypothetical protein
MFHNRKLRKAPTSVIDCGWRTMVESKKYVILNLHKTPWHHHTSQIGQGGCKKSTTAICHGAAMTEICQHWHRHNKKTAF